MADGWGPANGDDLWERADELEARGDREAARSLYLEAMADGVTGAGVEYGDALLRWGEDPAEAERLFRASMASGEDWNGDERLAELLRSSGRVDEAEEVLRSGLARGHTYLARLLGHVLSDDRSGCRAEAESWYRTALAEGDPYAANDLAAFLSDDPERRDEARGLLVQAYLAGDDLAAGNLGTIAWEDGDLAEGRRWLRIAAEEGQHDKLLSLAELEDEAGDDAACAAYLRRAIGHGVAGAHTAYARYLVDRDEEPPVVEAALQVAVDADDEEADFAYAAWLEEQGRLKEALGRYRRAAEDGDRDAYLPMARVLSDLGREDEAEGYLREGLESGDPSCAVAYARFLAGRGRHAEIPALAGRAAELDAAEEEIAEIRALAVS
ncbi:hypothetical protein ACFY4C_02090 [Actinomadura viridis]|uniref:hypothetical protein n=1 Tax=Actinomadura viridis TaxID=58110 RepID=UPI0036B23A34